jgi:hypothetical protein
MVRKSEEQAAQDALDWDNEYHDDFLLLSKAWDEIYFLIIGKNDADREKAASTATKLVKYFADRVEDKTLFTIKCTAILKRSGVKDNKLIKEITEDYKEFFKKSKEYKHLKSKEVWAKMNEITKKFLDGKHE